MFQREQSEGSPFLSTPRYSQTHLCFMNRKNGHFTFPGGKEDSGSLSLDGKNSVLKVWGVLDKLKFSDADTILGVLEDQKKVSLLRCIQSSARMTFEEHGSAWSYEIFPHEVVIGSRHVAYEDEVISGVSFFIGDAADLFYFAGDFFGTLSIKQDQLRDLLAEERDEGKRIPDIGMHPLLAYYTDSNRGEIIAAETVLGRVSAWNQISYSVGGPEGAGIKNRILCHIKFPTPISVPELEARLNKILQLFDLSIGRAQDLLEIKVHLAPEPSRDSQLPQECSVHYNMRTDHSKDSYRHREPDYRDVLINASRETDDFRKVLIAWVKRGQDPDWHRARWRFFSGWKQGRDYTADRLASAANMFDLLPSMQLPTQPLPGCLGVLTKHFRLVLKQLPRSQQRNRVLDALGRVTAPTLRQKIEHRAEIITDVIGHLIPDMGVVIKTAVNCRNYIVHGSGSPVIRRIADPHLPFLVDSLEFIFGASDLIDLGWDIAQWCERQKAQRHPFDIYLAEYKNNCASLKRALGA